MSVATSCLNREGLEPKGLRNIDNGVAGVQFVVGPCRGHARKDGRTGFSSAAPAALQPLRWPHGVRKRCTCRASTLKMAVQGSQALCLPRFNLLDARTGFSSAAPVTQTNGICKIIVQTQPTTREAPTPSPKIISVSGAKNEPKN